jgi:hypothetical protein
VDNEQIVQAMIEQVQAGINEPLGDEHLERLERNINTKVEQGETLRKFQLENADEPDFVFRAFRRES